MSVKRLAIPLCAVIMLLVLAGALQLVVIMFSSGSEAMAAEGLAASAAPIVSQVKTAVVFEQRSEKARQTEIALPARDLAEQGAISVGGSPIDQERAEALVKGADDFTANVLYINQKPVLASGCELVALTVSMNAEGIEVAPGDFVKYLRIGSNVATDYLGDPARNGGGLPPVVVEAANAWAAEKGLSARALDLTGTTFDGVLSLVELGYPVMTWTTEGLQEPRFRSTEQDGMRWYSPEHCVVVYGVEGDSLLVSDSLEGLVNRSLADFSRIYEACGSKSVVVQP